MTDYYEVLQISPNAEPETIHRVFRMLAIRYHPDNPETGSNDKFMQLRQAYEVLTDPEKRSAYDDVYRAQREQPLAIFGLRDFTEGIEGETNRRMGILCLLYHKRRINPEEPGMSLLQLESVMSFPREHLGFTLWFLQQKNYIRFNENSEYEITGEGTEYTESNTPLHEDLRKLLNSPQSVTPEPTRPVGKPASAGPVEFRPPIQQARSDERPRTGSVQTIPLVNPQVRPLDYGQS
jgi:curved DNA-binding protein